MLEVEITRSVGAFTLDVALKTSSGVTAVFGPSGAGKTTLARCVAGLDQPDAGRIVLDGIALNGPGGTVPAYRRGIGYVFQEPRLFPHLDVRANLLYGAPRGVDPGAVAEMLDIAPLLARRPAGLSGGEAARVALGRALLRAPRLLVLDEPLASLDRRRRSAILPYLERLRDTGMPILYISHAIEEVARLATTLILMRDGKLAAQGPVGDLLSDPEIAAGLGPDQAGALIEGVVQAFEGGLARLETPVGALEVAGVEAPVGGKVRVRIRAEDVILATRRPEGLSARNVLPCRIADLHGGQGPGVMVRLDAGAGRLLARLTRRSVEEMALVEGQAVWAVLKTSGVSRLDVGG